MKKLILLYFILAISLSSFAQQKSYGNKTVRGWILEKFPLHYSIKPDKAMTYRNSITNKLEKYQELNEIGQPNGLTVIMCNDGINPGFATYFYKGESVYSATFFPNSNIAQLILNYNTNADFDGYKITRTPKESGGYTEEILKYNNGVLVETNGVKTTPISIVYKDSLLDGSFKFESSPFVIEGIAEKGKLKKIKQSQENILMCEINFLKDSIKIKESGDYGFTFRTLPIISNPTITNSKSFCLKYGNFNGYPYLIFPPNFHVWDLIEIIPKHFPDSLITQHNYVDNLLDGKFKYRQYILSSTYSVYEYVNVYGIADKGKLLTLFLLSSGIDGVSATKYTFEGDVIKQIELDLKTGEEKSIIKTMKLEYPILLTNSTRLGGTYKLSNNSWDESINNPNNTLGIPFKRKGYLEENKYGYAYFSPYTFDIDNYLDIVTTKTIKP